MFFDNLEMNGEDINEDYTLDNEINEHNLQQIEIVSDLDITLIDGPNETESDQIIEDDRFQNDGCLLSNETKSDHVFEYYLFQNEGCLQSNETESDHVFEDDLFQEDDLSMENQQNMIDQTFNDSSVVEEPAITGLNAPSYKDVVSKNTMVISSENSQEMNLCEKVNLILTDEKNKPFIGKGKKVAVLSMKGKEEEEEGFEITLKMTDIERRNYDENSSIMLRILGSNKKDMILKHQKTEEGFIKIKVNDIYSLCNNMDRTNKGDLQFVFFLNVSHPFLCRRYGSGGVRLPERFKEKDSSFNVGEEISFTRVVKRKRSSENNNCDENHSQKRRKL